MSAQQNLSPEYLAEYSGYKLVALAATMIPVVVIFVALRFYARSLKKTPWGLDDFLVLISMILQIGLSAVAICFVKYGGVGRHFAAWEVIEPSRTTTYFKYLLVVSFYYFFCVAWPKLSILAFYARIFPLRTYQWIIIGLACIVATTGIICSVMTLNLCHPFQFNWDRTIPGGRCVDEQAFYRWGSLPNIITDVAMLILPLPAIWKLQTSFNTKIGLTVAFATGSLGLATSIVRFTSFFKGSAVQDGTWASVDLMIWTIVEPDVYLIASCLLSFRPLFVRFISGSKAEIKTTEVAQKLQSFGRTRYATRADSQATAVPGAESWLDSEEKDSTDVFNTGKSVSAVTTDGTDTLHSQRDLEPGKIHVRQEYDVSVSAV